MKRADSERTSLGLSLAKSLYFSVPHLQKDYYKRDDWHTESRPNTHHPLLLSFIRQALTSHPLRGFCEPGLLGHILLFFHPSPCSHSLSQAPFLPSRPFMNNVGPARQRPSGSGDHICSTATLAPDFWSSQIDISNPELSLPILDWISSCLWADSHGFLFGFGNQSQAGSGHQHWEPEHLFVA